MTKRIVALVPARSGSKGVKDKNIQKLNEKTLLELSIEAALASERIQDVYVSTDSELYAKIAVQAGAVVPFLRPNSLSGDHIGDYEVFEHFLSYIPLGSDDLIVHLRPTTPRGANSYTLMIWPRLRSLC